MLWGDVHRASDRQLWAQGKWEPALDFALTHQVPFGPQARVPVEWVGWEIFAGFTFLPAFKEAMKCKLSHSHPLSPQLEFPKLDH